MSLVSAMSRTEMLGDRCQVVRGRVGAAVLGQGAKSGFYLLPGPGLAWRCRAVLSVRADINLISKQSSDANMPCTAHSRRWRPHHSHHHPIMENKRNLE